MERGPGQRAVPGPCSRARVDDRPPAEGGTRSCSHRWQCRFGHASAPARLDLRAAVLQHERRSRAGILQRRHQRGHHHRPEQGLLARRRIAQHCVHVQGQERRPAAGGQATEGQLRARGQRAPRGRARAHHRPADRGVERQPSLGRALRPRPERHFRAAGRDLRGDSQGAQAQAAARGEEGNRAARHDEPAGLQPLPDGPAALRERPAERYPQERHGHSPLEGSHRPRPRLRPRLGAHGERAAQSPVCDEFRRRRLRRRDACTGTRRQPRRGARGQGRRTGVQG